jgi:hypothetical protein
MLPPLFTSCQVHWPSKKEIGSLANQNTKELGCIFFPAAREPAGIHECLPVLLLVSFKRVSLPQETYLKEISSFLSIYAKLAFKRCVFKMLYLLYLIKHH